MPSCSKLGKGFAAKRKVGRVGESKKSVKNLFSFHVKLWISPKVITVKFPPLFLNLLNHSLCDASYSLTDITHDLFFRSVTTFPIFRRFCDDKFHGSWRRLYFEKVFTSSVDEEKKRDLISVILPLAFKVSTWFKDTEVDRWSSNKILIL